MFTVELAAHTCVSPAHPVIPRRYQILDGLILTSRLPLGETQVVLLHCQWWEQGLGRAACLINMPGSGFAHLLLADWYPPSSQEELLSLWYFGEKGCDFSWVITSNAEVVTHLSRNNKMLAFVSKEIYMKCKCLIYRVTWVICFIFLALST